jgi:hypothetical protein
MLLLRPLTELTRDEKGKQVIYILRSYGVRSITPSCSYKTTPITSTGQ